MPAFLSLSVEAFLSRDTDILAGQLVERYAATGFTDLKSEQVHTWHRDLGLLHNSLITLAADKPVALNWTLVFEFSVPRKNDRIDLILLAGTDIILLEMKTGEVSAAAAAQLERYALLLHYFHKPSNQRVIRPITVGSAALPQKPLAADQLQLDLPTLATYWIRPIQSVTWADLARKLAEVDAPEDGASQIDPQHWINGEYHPVPTIIEAARDLRQGLQIADIAHSEASEHEVQDVAKAIHFIVSEARRSRQHVICFLTGVPGSGKTLVGLSLAHLHSTSEDAIHFMSGNGPLVMVLQENFRKQAMQQGIRAVAAKIQSEALIENVHVFARNYTTADTQRAPSNHVVIFDEAQRAWNREQNFRNSSETTLNRKCFSRSWHDIRIGRS